MWAAEGWNRGKVDKALSRLRGIRTGKCPQSLADQWQRTERERQVEDRQQEREKATEMPGEVFFATHSLPEKRMDTT